MMSMRMVWYCTHKEQVVPDNTAEDKCRIRVCRCLETRMKFANGQIVVIP
jgi:hypothetical protein